MTTRKRITAPTGHRRTETVGVLMVRKASGVAVMSHNVERLPASEVAGVSLAIDSSALRWVVTAPTLDEALAQMAPQALSVLVPEDQPERGTYRCDIERMPATAASTPPETGATLSLVTPDRRSETGESRPSSSCASHISAIAALVAYQHDANRDVGRGEQLRMFHLSELTGGSAGKGE